MHDKSQNLTVSSEELAVIEDALHTQSQILNVQASAGGDEARVQLNAVKGVLARLAQQQPKTKRTASAGAGGSLFGWFARSRSACH